jgi:hypothetical protein
MAERLADVLGNKPFTKEEEAVLKKLGYIDTGIWWASPDGKTRANKIELIEILKEEMPESPRAEQYPLPLYMYSYDAKHKARLPIWDRFPVILYLGPIPNGFEGINIHYIPQEARMILLNQIMDILDNDGDPGEAIALITEVGISYKGYKKYLNSYVRTGNKPIPRDQWEEAFQSPGNFIYK